MTCLENVALAWKWADPDWHISKNSDLCEGGCIHPQHVAICWAWLVNENELIYTVFVRAEQDGNCWSPYQQKVVDLTAANILLLVGAFIQQATETGFLEKKNFTC